MSKLIRFAVPMLLVTYLAAPLWGDLFWVGGSGLWNEPFKWSSTLGGVPGSGPPTIFISTRFDGLSGTLQVNFAADGDGGDVQLRLDDANVLFDLGGNSLNLQRDFFTEAVGSETNTATITNGTLTARALSARSIAFGQQHVIVDPTTHVTLRRISLPTNFASQLTAFGPNAEIEIQGSVGMDDSALAVASDGGTVRVNDGQLDIQGRMELDTFGDLELLNNGTASIHETLDIGINDPADLRASSNSSLFTFGPVTLGVNSGAAGNVELEDAGSRWELRDAITVGSAGSGVVTVADNAQLLALDPSAHVRLGAAATGSGQLTVGDTVGGPTTFSSQASVFVAGTETAAGGSGQLTVRPTGSVDIDGQIKVWGSGRVEALGGDISSSQLVVTSGGRLVIDDGGSIEAMTVNLQSGANLSGFDDGELIVRGPGGASFSTPSASFGFGSDSGLPTIHLDNATSFVTDWTIANFPGAAAKTVVSGQQGRLDASGNLQVTGPNTQNDGRLDILDGGLAQARNNITLAFSSTSTAHVVVDGSAGGQRSLLRNTAQGPDGEIEIGRNGQATLDVLNGALVQSLNHISIASQSSAQGTVNVTGSASGGTSQLVASNDLAVGGFATADTVGGTGLLSINDRGHAIGGQRVKVYPGSTIEVSPGGLLESPRLHVCGDVNNDGVINIGGSSLATADGDLVVSSTGELILDGGTLRSRNLELEAGATLDLAGGTLQVDGGQLQLNRTSLVFGSPTGASTVELSNGATAAVTFAWHMGSAAGTGGATVVRNAGSRLENTGGGGGADLIAGVSGSGSLEVLDGGVVDFNDDVIAAENAGSNGSIFVRGVEGTERATLRAVGGTNSDIVIGFEGFGGMDVVDGALVESADDLYVGLVAGSDGVVTVSGSQNGFDATVIVGDILAIGATFTDGAVVDKGSGLMVIATGGHVDVANTTYVGPNDMLAVGGRFHTGALDIESDLSRLDWQAGEIALTASGLTIASGGTLDRIVSLDDDMVLSVHTTRRVDFGGVVLMEGGQFIGSAELIIENGGFLGGHGTVATPVFMENSGRVQPQGTLNIEGHFVQVGGEVGVTIGPNPGETDLLAVTQIAQLDGTLEISAGSLLDPDVAGTVEAYSLLVANTVTGSFETVIYDVTDLTALADVQPDGSFSVYVGESASGDDGLFRSLEYSGDEVTFANYLALPGDANGDRAVDGQDFRIWNANKFQSGTDWTTGDFNGDGMSDGHDFLIWNSHKFMSAIVSRTVPEPALPIWALSFVLVAIGRLCRNAKKHT